MTSFRKSTAFVTVQEAFHACEAYKTDFAQAPALRELKEAVDRLSAAAGSPPALWPEQQDWVRFDFELSVDCGVMCRLSL